MARLSFASAIRRATPPWLQRSVAARFLDAIGVELDALAEDTAAGAGLRFPRGDGDELALALVGRERRIRRGPGESAATYASRLLPWWDAHRTRGNAFALLRQLYAFFRDTLNVRMDVVYHSGTRRWVDQAGEITADSITWGADGSDQWSQVWLFFWLPEAPLSILTTLEGDVLVTLEGDTLVTLGGTTLLGSDPVVVGETLRAIPREWSAAHVLRISIVLIWPEAELWGYPPGGTWADDDPAPGQVWQTEDPVILLVE